VNERDDLLIATIQCKSCGAKWIVTEEIPEQPDPNITRIDTYRCAKCGAAAVFEIGVSKIEPRQG
jgi:DNA-directed RNA polymerase subunit RPC12/RpoP